MKLIFLGIGSNLKNPKKNVEKALKAIEKLKEIFEFKSSALYRTSPVSEIPQEDYINAVCTFKTKNPYQKIWKELCSIERKMGKIQKPKNAPRIIDIDFLLYGEDFIEDSELIVPHPEMLKRLFVLQPLHDLENSINYATTKGKTTKIQLQSLIQTLKALTKDQISMC